MKLKDHKWKGKIVRLKLNRHVKYMVLGVVDTDQKDARGNSHSAGSLLLRRRDGGFDSCWAHYELELDTFENIVYKIKESKFSLLALFWAVVVSALALWTCL